MQFVEVFFGLDDLVVVDQGNVFVDEVIGLLYVGYCGDEGDYQVDYDYQVKVGVQVEVVGCGDWFWGWWYEGVGGVEIGGQGYVYGDGGYFYLCCQGVFQ